MSNPDLYTVGWIVARPVEADAAAAFLEEEHDLLVSQPRHDINSYTLGKIAGHNVVIAALPSGFYGKVSAASTASHMIRTFENIRMVLTVGIGGGAPTKANDIRLGDVVVGNKGVLPYDMGKDIQGMDKFHITGNIHVPPMFLGTVVTNLGSRMRRQPKGHDLRGKIETALEAGGPFLRKSCRRPDPTSDRLYHANILHADAEADCSDACGSGPENLIEKGPREDDEEDVKIHYGLIASADQVMRNAITRDRFSKDHKVLCFEMEAAGLMHQFPCLAIRGIYNYSDTHKHKAWQGYAAMAAAAYARDLLSIMPQETVSKVKLKRKERFLTSSQKTTTFTNIFLELPSIEEQKEKKGWMLFCPGDLRSGKTIFTSILIGITYLYFNFKRQEEQTLDKLLAAVLRQLIPKQGSAMDDLMALYIRHGCSDQPSRPKTSELIILLNQMLPKFEKIYLVIDALDECPSPTPRAKYRLNILITARTKTRITQSLQVDHSQLITSRPTDIKHFLTHELLSQFPEFMGEDSNSYTMPLAAFRNIQAERSYSSLLSL
ncbi:unnamed protein product [Clonostachys rosea]|uniref:Nucleoside phosphorylase domain-containing protein n=1 Tax=Bionectria ochroleuca TaxID=29856 RepID=A0ABY6UFM8_BIOOC|nr:unnamed protein product [Clonostachys rosea]